MIKKHIFPNNYLRILNKEDLSLDIKKCPIVPHPSPKISILSTALIELIHVARNLPLVQIREQNTFHTLDKKI